MGVLAEWFILRGSGSPDLRLFLATGVLGGFTTFSAFSLDAAVLWQRGDQTALAVYVLGSVGRSMGGLFLGIGLVRAMV